jgi:alkylation response protein AidB-like acyl-CoA dehydrogenase
LDFRFSTDELAYERDVHDFLKAGVPDWWSGIFVLEEEDYRRAWNWSNGFAKELAKRDMLVPGWPREHGGIDLDPLKQLILAEQLAYFDDPRGAHYMGGNWVGPVLLRMGSEEQKRRYLPGIREAREYWCQGFSEPNAGSDLASLQSRAVREGDVFVINGQKIWTSYAERAQYCVFGARTDPDVPKHKGITYFVIDMKAPGVTVRPIPSLFGPHFNEVFLEDVRVPVEDVLGEVNGGWYLMAGSLDVERSGVGYAGSWRWLDLLARWLREQGIRLPAPLKARFANAYAEVEVSKWTARRTMFYKYRSQQVTYEPSQGKLFQSEIYQRIAHLAMDIVGLGGQLTMQDPRAPLKGRIERIYRWQLETTVAGGTSEIQRNVIATRGLGMPRA